MDLRIFLSSTSLDLDATRQRVLRLLSVIPADLIRMEAFGSDESKPADYSLEQVRKCNLFIGIYAERYGTIEERSKCSVTELEYHEAYRLLEEGRLLGLLVYVLDPAATWKVEHVDREPESVNALKKFKCLVEARHTVGFFKDAEDLPLQILRDVLRKVGVGPSRAFQARQAFAPLGAHPPRPLGMEHYTEGDAAWFRGREDAVADVCELLGKNPLVLLIGDSGIGKTSAVQAGVFPALRKKGWLVATSRPLDAPDDSIPRAVWHELMNGPRPPESTGTILQLVASAHNEHQILVVIDQLEDIIPNLPSEPPKNLLEALCRIYNSPPANLHLLLCYRGDAEPKVGHFWQTISGSAVGLPRYYLEPLTRGASTSAAGDILAALSPAVGPSEFPGLLEELVADTEAESLRSLGVEIYPPFLQMVLEILANTAAKSGRPVSLALFRSLGGSRQIIARYLGDQLRLLGSRVKENRLVLTSLATRYRRLRRSHEELCNDTGLTAGLVDACLKDLANLRLVHGVEGKWELVHDFLASKVLEELVSPEEREAKIFRDVLVAKAAAFESTGELPTYKEHLGIYAHRSRIAPTPGETEILFASALRGNGPAGYFLRSVPCELPVTWAEVGLRSQDQTARQNAYRFLIAHGSKFDLSDLADAFSDYKLQDELSGFIRLFATGADISLLLRLRRKNAELVRAAAYERLTELIKSPDEQLLTKLARISNSDDTRLLFNVLASDAAPSPLTEQRANIRGPKLTKRLFAICGLSMHGTAEDIELIEARMRTKRSGRVEKELCAFSLARWAQARRRQRMLKDLLSGPDQPCSAALAALDGSRGGVNCRQLLAQYRRLPFDVAAAVRRTATRRDYAELKRFLSLTRFTPPCRDLLCGLLRAGGAKGAQWVLKAIGGKDYEVRFWNVPVLGQAMRQAVSSEIKPWLTDLAQSDEFWTYTFRERGKKPLPVKAFENLYLFKRLLGFALPSVCGVEDWELLRRLVSHDYWHVQASAADRVGLLATAEHLAELVEDARSEAKVAPDPGFVYALNLLDERLYGPPPTPDRNAPTILRARHW